jgi:hypothetical protein
MCIGPELIAGLALSAAGNYMNTKEQNKNASRAVEARQNSLRQEMARQKEYQDKSSSDLFRILDQYTPANAQAKQAELQASREAALNDVVSPVNQGDYAPMTNDAPQVVKDSLQKGLKEASARSAAAAKSSAGMYGLGDLLFRNGLNTANIGSGMATNAGFAKRSSDINTLEQEIAARNSQKSSSGIGDLLGLAGQGLSLYGGINGSGSLFGGELAMPAGQFGPGQYSKFAKIQNLWI